eukprot:CAMPEP_0118945920 /NCGR_PEP_ID=MMETSP1169-20130426/43253_1 /TAXON_ID=36882 /ORGANISM="Pyramimonas obovata, Strain CCMP722" /LENGTH=512 /DNA_ID=CAMNT_0006891767 /DNA_START=480 /DNA_END=2019 /DNA_ORIENTATION=-
MSCQQVRELMRAVRPDHVLVELDDERLGVLVDFGEQQSGQEDILWYTEQIRLEPPLPDVFGMPKSSKLLEPLQAQPFFPITGQQMTEDAQRLLRTGLFSSAAAAPYPPSPDMGPMMVGDVASGSVRQVNAMGRLAFRTEPQQLPAVGAVSVRVAPQVTLLIPDALPQEVEALAQRVVAVGLEAERPTHHSCLQIAEEARALLPEGVHLSFCIPEPSILGVLLQPSEVPEGDADIATGLEAFGAGAIGYAPTATKRTAQTIRLGGGSDLKAQLGIAALREMLARPSAEFQQMAANKLGMEKPGGEFRAALEEAVLMGAEAVLLGDQPISVTRQRISELVWDKAKSKVAALVGAAVAAATLIAGAEDLPVSPSVAAGGVLAAAVTASAYILSEPVREQAAVAGLSAEDLGEGVSKLLSDGYESQQVNAETSAYEAAMLEERDAYMGRTLRAMARGDAANIPGFVRLGEAAAAAGLERMQYRPRAGATLTRPRTVVAVVGLAHVAGVCKAWEEAA